jgi:hypothetical protein
MTDVAACAMRGLKRSKVEELLQIIIINLCLQLCVLYAHGPTLQRLGGLLGTSAERLFALCTRAIHVFRMKIPEFSSNLFFG